MSPQLLSAYRFFHEHGATMVGHAAEQAIALARAELAAEERGDIKVAWEDETEAWDGEGPAPDYLLCCSVECDGEVASLGMIGLNSLRDPYMRVIEAELKAEVLAAQTICPLGWATCCGGLEP